MAGVTALISREKNVQEVPARHFALHGADIRKPHGTRALDHYISVVCWKEVASTYEGVQVATKIKLILFTLRVQVSSTVTVAYTRTQCTVALALTSLS